MKKRFFKKLKKYVLVLSCVLCCLIILSIPVSANTLTVNDFNIGSSYFAIPGVSGYPASGVKFFLSTPSSDLIEQSTKYFQTTTKAYTNANYINDRIEFVNKNKYIILNKNTSFSGSISGFHFGWIVITDPTSGTLGYIWLNEDVSISLDIYFIDKNEDYHRVPVTDFSFSNEGSGLLNFNCYNVPVDCIGFSFSLVYNVDDNDLIDERNLMPLSWYIRNNRVYSHDLSLQNFNFNFSYEKIPVSEQPIYISPSSGSTSELEGIESELVGSTNSAAQEEINKSFNISFDLIQQWAYPISAFRDAFNYFVSSHNAIYTICIMSLVIGVFLLFSNFVPRGRDK